VDNSQSLTINGSATIAGSLGQDAGSTLVVNGSATIDDLSSDGTIQFTNPAAALTVNGNFGLAGASVIQMSASDTSISSIVICGQATLAGDLTVSLFGVKSPTAKQVYSPFTWYSGNTGTFNLTTWRIGDFAFWGTYTAPQINNGTPGGLTLTVAIASITTSGNAYEQIAGQAPGEWEWLYTFWDDSAPGLTINDYTFQLDWGDGNVSTWTAANPSSDMMITQDPGYTNKTRSSASTPMRTQATIRDMW
jgi:hypothetical protein